MAFVSLKFIIFFILLFFSYYVLFPKQQWKVLLIGSLIFYAYASPYYLIFLLFSVIISYIVCNRLPDSTHKKGLVALGISCNLLILGILKYTGFFLDNVQALLGQFHIETAFPEINWILPLGISFYTFMTIGYCIDIYRGVCEPQKDFYKHLLFLSFFPQITQGPINRYEEMSVNLFRQHAFDFSVMKQGGYRILKGLFKKLIIAGRLGVYVDRVYADIPAYDAFTLLLATFFYALQIYCDFSGYVDIVCGLSEMLGIPMSENFERPYFSKSIPEYWRRWHITLGSWFRDYLYYPVIRSEFCRKLKKFLNKKVSRSFGANVTTSIGLACVWFMTGLWHGASWHYVIHGLYHGVIIISGVFLASFYKKTRTALRINEKSRLFSVFQIVRTFILVDFSYIFFRSETLSDAFLIIKKIFTEFSINVSVIKQSLLPFTEDNTAVSYFIITFAAVSGLFIVEVFEELNLNFFKRHKYVLACIMIVTTLLFGIFGQSGFLYMQY